MEIGGKEHSDPMFRKKILRDGEGVNIEQAKEATSVAAYATARRTLDEWEREGRKLHFGLSRDRDGREFVSALAIGKPF